VHFVPYYYPHYGHHAGFDWTEVAAFAALGLALVTGWLAISTRQLARASTDDQRAQWQPIVTVDAGGHAHYNDTTGELSFDLRNLGRGPAFAVSAELRSGTQSLGASIPGLWATALAPGESFELHARIIDPSQNIRGRVVKIEVSYYDVTEYWHKTHLTMAGRVPPGEHHGEAVRRELQITAAFFEQTNTRLLPVTGSPRAIEEDLIAKKPPGQRLVHWLKSRVGR
jgi:hypothetical protein